MNYDPNAPNLVLNKQGSVVGIVTRWNPYGIGEAIVQFFDGSADSCIFKELNFLNGADRAREYLNKRES